MKKDRANVFSFKLSAYATFAASFLSIHKTEAQVIYTDIDPDIIYDEKLEGGGLDIDANGTIDFVFLNSSFTFYDYIFLSFSGKPTAQLKSYRVRTSCPDFFLFL